MTQKPTKPVAVVTGGWRGIGLGIATKLAHAGYDLAITGLGGLPGADDILTSLKQAGSDAIYLEADLSAIESHAVTVATVVQHFGRIDCLINNAGIASLARGDFLEMLPENFDRILAVNLRGTVFFTQSVVNAMLANHDPVHPRSIINITSISAQSSSPERLDYCISKAGLSAFSQGLALRLADSGIAVFEVRPGIIRSDMTAGVAAKYDSLIDSGLVPMKRWGEASDIGSMCLALASGNFAFATGTVIDADGGLSIPRL